MPEEKTKPETVQTNSNPALTADTPKEPKKSSETGKKSILDIPYPATEGTIVPETKESKADPKPDKTSTSPVTKAESSTPKDSESKTPEPVPTTPTPETSEKPESTPEVIESESSEPFVTPDPTPSIEKSENVPPTANTEPVAEKIASNTSSTTTPTPDKTEENNTTHPKPLDSNQTEEKTDNTLEDLAAKATIPEKTESVEPEKPKTLTASEKSETSSPPSTTSSPLINRDEIATPPSKKGLIIKVFAGIFAILIIGALVYVGIRFNPFASSPKKLFSPQSEPITKSSPTLTLTLQQPENELLTFDSSVLVSGTTIPNVQVLITTDTRNKVIQSQEDGSFSTLMNLDEGVNNLKVTTFDQSGMQKSDSRSVFYSKEEI